MALPRWDGGSARRRPVGGSIDRGCDCRNRRVLDVSAAFVAPPAVGPRGCPFFSATSLCAPPWVASATVPLDALSVPAAMLRHMGASVPRVGFLGGIKLQRRSLPTRPVSVVSGSGGARPDAIRDPWRDTGVRVTTVLSATRLKTASGDMKSAARPEPVLTVGEQKRLMSASSVQAVVDALGALRKRPVYQWHLIFPTFPGTPESTVDIEHILEQLVSIWMTTMRNEAEGRYILSGLVAEAGSGKSFIAQQLPRRASTLFKQQRNVKRKATFSSKVSFLGVNFNSTFSVRHQEVTAIIKGIIRVEDLWRLRLLFSHYAKLSRRKVSRLFERYIVGVLFALKEGLLEPGDIAVEASGVMQATAARKPGGNAVLLVDEPAKADENTSELRKFIRAQKEDYVHKDGYLPAASEILLASMCAEGDRTRVCV